MAFDPTRPVHFGVRPFKAVCRADVPGQQTTEVYANVTCEHCVEACGLVPVDEAELAAIEAGVRISLPYQRQVPYPRTSAGVVFRLMQEVRRLRRGEFTPGEFQDLCHHLDGRPGCDLQAFVAGCRDYQAKLFGFKAVEEHERERFKAHYAGQTEPCCECGESYPRGDLVIDGQIYCPACRPAHANDPRTRQRRHDR